jgi:hypothetical protein
LSGRRDSNPRHSAWEADTLPTELRPRTNKIITELGLNQEFFNYFLPQNFSAKIKMTKHRKDQVIELTLLAIILIVSFILWDTYFVYPIKLSVVLMHEVSHAIATLLTGGNIVGMNIGLDLSGSCQTEGGNAIAIASSGYLGSFLFGILFFVSPNKVKIGKWIIISVTAIIFIITAIASKEIFFIFLVAFFSLLIILLANYMSIPIISILFRSFGLISCVYVLFDIKEDLLEKHIAISDVSLLSSLTGISGVIYGIVWMVLSLSILVLAVRFCYRSK